MKISGFLSMICPVEVKPAAVITAITCDHPIVAAEWAKLVFVPSKQKLGLIAGNGTFPLLMLDAACAQGAQVVVAAIKEETSPLIEQRGAAAVHWLSLGELGKLIDTFKKEGVRTAVMAGQVKHKQIFSAIRPDWRLAKVLF